VLLFGEWWTSNLFFGAVFLIAGLGVVGIAWWVLRGSARNRAAVDVADPGTEIVTPERGH
jgi:hypothetical protein